MTTRPVTHRIHLDGGVTDADRPTLEGALTRLLTRLDSYPPDACDLWVRVKDRDRPGMTTTVDLTVPRLGTLSLHETGPDLGAALHRIGDVMVQELNEAKDRRTP